MKPRDLPTYLTCCCSIVAIILICIITAAGNNANVTGSHGGRILSPGMNMLEFHVKNSTTNTSRVDADNDPYWAWEEGYMFRWYLNSAWMEPDFTSTEIGAQNLYRGIGHSFNLTEIIFLGFELAPGYHENTTTPTLDVQIDVVPTLAPFACYTIGILSLFLELILQSALCCLGRGKDGRSTALISVMVLFMVLFSVIAFATITAASGYLTAKSYMIRDGILSSAYVVSGSIGSSFLGLVWGAVGVSVINIGVLVLDVMMWRSRDPKEGILLDTK